MKKDFPTVKKFYDAFERDLLKQGKLPHKDTGVGFWGVTHCDDLHGMFEYLNPKKGQSLVDLGSGDGRAVLIGSLFGLQTLGIEADEWLSRVGIQMKNTMNVKHFENVRLLNKDFMTHDISEFDYIYCSPDKPFHHGLESKMKKELRGTLIVHGPEFLPKDLAQVGKVEVNGNHFFLYRNNK